MLDIKLYLGQIIIKIHFFHKISCALQLIWLRQLNTQYNTSSHALGCFPVQLGLAGFESTRLSSTQLVNSTRLDDSPTLFRAYLTGSIAVPSPGASRAWFSFVRRASCRETENNGGVRGEIKTAYGLFIFRRRAATTTTTTTAMAATCSLRSWSFCAKSLRGVFRFISVPRVYQASTGASRTAHDRYIRGVSPRFTPVTLSRFLESFPNHVETLNYIQFVEGSNKKIFLYKLFNFVSFFVSYLKLERNVIGTMIDDSD